MSSPLDRLEAEDLRGQLRDALNGRFVGGDVAWGLLSTWDALVNVAKAAEFAVHSIDPNSTLARKTLEDALAALDKID